jgi:N-sulfoglucosamine sulfohydrolase
MRSILGSICLSKINCNVMAAGALGFLAAGCGSGSDKNREKPNILLVIADDLGTEVGCYGDKHAVTPGIDKFASENVQFFNAYVTQSSSSPSRSSILTGLFPHQNNQLGLSHRGFEMHEGILTISALLHDNGYYTGVMGKIHVGPRSAHKYDLATGGLDTPGPGRESEKWTSDSVDVINMNFRKERRIIEFTRDIDRVADTAAQFFKRAGDRPFFLHISFIDPHDPYYQKVGKYPETLIDTSSLQAPAWTAGNKVSKSRLAGHYNSVKRVDMGFRLLLEKLKESGKYDNTIIIFIGDNGAPFPRGKVTIYEGGLRVPFLIRVPGMRFKGRLDELVSTVDIMPTLLDAAGINAPEGLPGMSLLPLVNGNKEWRKYLFAEFTYHTAETFFPLRSINDGRYKLIYSPMMKDFQNVVKTVSEPSRQISSNALIPEIRLYDLESDPYEIKDLAGDQTYGNEKERLLGELKKWMKETKDPLLVNNRVEEYRNVIRKLAEKNTLGGE